MSQLTVDSTVDTTAHSPSPYQLPPVSHPCLSGNWRRSERPPMDELAPLAVVIA